MQVVQVGERKFFPKSGIAKGMLNFALRMFDELTVDFMKEALASAVGGQNVLSSIESLIEPFNDAVKDKVWTTLFLILQQSPEALKFLFSRKLFEDGKHTGWVEIPKGLASLADIEWNPRGQTVGCGEILALLLFADVIACDPGGRYDLVSQMGNIHVKDHRKCDSTTLGSSSANDLSWETSRPFKMLQDAGINIRNFGNMVFREHPHLESVVMKEYGSDIFDAAAKFENDLHNVIRQTEAFGDVCGVLFLELNDEGTLGFSFVSPSDVYFHSTTMDGTIKVGKHVGRFIDKITMAERQRIDERNKLAIRIAKQAEREAEKQRKQAEREAEKMRRAEERKAARLKKLALKQEQRVKKAMAIAKKKTELRTRQCKKCSEEFYDSTKQGTRKTCFTCNPLKKKGINIGIVYGSFKPLHRGHWFLIQEASKDCDEVHVYASTSDRDNVLGSAMERAWNECLKQHLPTNVKLFLGGVPIRRVYEELGEANEAKSKNVYHLYSDVTDVSRFPLDSCEKYFGDIMLRGNVKFKTFARSGELAVSGTMMREHLKAKNKLIFLACLPGCVDGELYWSILTNAK